MSWVRHHPPVLIVKWWGLFQWVSPLQPSTRSAGLSFFSLFLCCCSSRDCNMGLLWFPSLSWLFIIFSWITSLMNGTFRSSCRVWLVTYQGTFVIIRSILDWLHCILAICNLLAHTHWLVPLYMEHFCNEKLCLLYPVVCDLSYLYMDTMQFEINQYNTSFYTQGDSWHSFLLDAELSPGP
jgi:hypothetical protein